MKAARILTTLMPFAAIAAIAGCSASRSSLPDSGAGTVPFEKASWVSPNARHGDLLYISNIGDASVTIYSWPKGELVGSLSGFFVEPEGLCSDSNGNVFITDDYLEETLEFAHGSSTVNQTLTDPGYVPNGCAVNPVNGDLAVANKIGPTRRSSKLGRGSVAIYRSASGTPINLVPHDVYSEYFCGYGANGDLFVNGYSENARHARFAELPNGSSSFHHAQTKSAHRLRRRRSVGRAIPRHRRRAPDSSLQHCGRPGNAGRFDAAARCYARRAVHHSRLACRCPRRSKGWDMVLSRRGIAHKGHYAGP